MTTVGLGGFQVSGSNVFTIYFLKGQKMTLLISPRKYKEIRKKSGPDDPRLYVLPNFRKPENILDGGDKCVHGLRISAKMYRTLYFHTTG